MDHDEVIVQVELALSTVKRVERESRLAKQTLARLRDTLQSENGHKENDEHRAADSR